MSNMFRCDKTSYKKLLANFRELLIIRSETYENMKITKIILSYHIFSDNYIDSIEREQIISENVVPVSTDEETKVKFISINKIFNLPLIYAGDVNFLLNFKEINKNISDEDSRDYKYKVIFDKLYDNETIVKIVLQSTPGLIVYKFTDKLIKIVKLEHHDIVLERTIESMGHRKYVYLIDVQNNEVLLVRQEDVNKKAKGFMQKLLIDPSITDTDLLKFLTIDIECKAHYYNEEDFNLIPILVASYDISRDEKKFEYINTSKISTLEADKMMQNFLIQFLTKKYHGFKFYAHNLSSFDGVFILNNLVQLSEKIKIKVEPLFRDRKLISIKVRYGWRYDQSKFRYHLEFRDSLLILLSSLKKLSETFLKDKPELQKLDNEDIIKLLLSKGNELVLLDGKFKVKLLNYCLLDCISLSNIFYRFAQIIFSHWKINVHKYPTLPSLALAIYKTHYLESDSLIPLISDDIYKDISKAYTGGHVDVYDMYSTDEVHSYDYASMYPAQMHKFDFPVGKIDKFEGNPLNAGYTIKQLSDSKAFILCDIYVDKSINRPTYQTHIKINNDTRTMCATGLFKNQWVYVPELFYYENLTNGLIKIMPDSIIRGYTFDSAKLFEKFIEDLFKIKNYVTKDNPMYLISKILMNSLYGRFGLKQELTEFNIIDTANIEEFVNGKQISDIIKFENTNKSMIIVKKEQDQVHLESSVSIAAAVTSYARMEMAPLLLDDTLDILYIDTDSAKCKQKITDIEKYKHLDHSGLGALKYEETYSESIFLLPKVYGGIIKDSAKELIKIKGFKNKTEFDSLKDILFKNREIVLSQNKMYRDWLKSEIKVKSSGYTLSLNENKRLIDFKNFKTKPYHFKEYNPLLINKTKNKKLPPVWNHNSMVECISFEDEILVRIHVVSYITE